MSAPFQFFVLGSKPTFPTNPWIFSPSEVAVDEDAYLTDSDPPKFIVPLMVGAHSVSGTPLESLRKVIRVASEAANPSIALYIKRLLAYQHKLWNDTPALNCCEEILAIAQGIKIWEQTAEDYATADAIELPGVTIGGPSVWRQSRATC